MNQYCICKFCNGNRNRCLLYRSV